MLAACDSNLSSAAPVYPKFAPICRAETPVENSSLSIEFIRFTPSCSDFSPASKAAGLNAFARLPMSLMAPVIGAANPLMSVFMSMNAKPVSFRR